MKKKKKKSYGLLQLIEYQDVYFKWDKGFLFMLTVSVSFNKNFIVSKCCVCMVCQSVCFHVFLFFHHVWCSTIEFLFKSMMCTIYQMPHRYSPWTSKAFATIRESSPDFYLVTPRLLQCQVLPLLQKLSFPPSQP